jgi:hypothetical protein
MDEILPDERYGARGVSSPSPPSSTGSDLETVRHRLIDAGLN